MSATSQDLHSFVLNNKDDPVLQTIARELRSSLNQTSSSTTNNNNFDDEISSAPNRYEFRLESFLTCPRTCSTLFPPRVQKACYSKIVVQERLILLSTGSASPNHDSKDLDKDKAEKEDKDTTTTEHVLIAGLEVLEYTLTLPPSSSGDKKALQERQERIIYVAKVDTSGYWPLCGLDSSYLRGKSPAQALVKGYLRFIRASASHASINTADTCTPTNMDTNDSSGITASATEAKMSALSIAPATATAPNPKKPSSSPYKVSLFIFARAQPQYLFANSAKNPQKRVLDDRGLVRWWKNTIASVYSEPIVDQDKSKKTGTTKMQGWWHIPGIETARQAQNIIQSSTLSSSSHGNSIDKGVFEWIYGYPDRDSSKLANALIPQFPDDPKSRMMQSPSCRGGFVNIQTFWELAAIGEESGAGKITGFFRVIFEDTEDVKDADDDEKLQIEKENQQKEEDEEGERQVTGTTGGYTKVINFLLDLDFSTIEAAKESTKQWQEKVEMWINRSIEKETKNIIQIQKARQGQAEQEEEKDENVEKDIMTPGEKIALRPLWIQKSTIEISLPQAPKALDVQTSKETTSVVTVEPTAATTIAAASPVIVNTLGAGLIKRKVPTPVSTASPPAHAPTVNVLNAGLIKRKPIEPTDTPLNASLNTPTVNILGANLIKRKAAPSSLTSIPPPSSTSSSETTTPTTTVVNVLGASFIKKRKTDS
ncbi:hypothetical protein FBU30_001995 [Linnemannia zychae]|nr:hypothetical protein FBU30_001995 [Linnemannia zychae]